jgi:hypothetical protein
VTTRAPLVAVAAAALALTLPAAAAPAAPVHAAKKLKNCGTITFSGRKTKILVIRSTKCSTAKRVARRYGKFQSTGRWRCALSHGNAKYRGHRYGFSCGRGASSGDLKKWPHAFIGAL